MKSLSKKISLMLAAVMIVNMIMPITVNAQNNTKVYEKFANIVLFVDFADSSGNFMDGKRDRALDIYNGSGKKSLANFISAISNGKMSISNYFPQDNGTNIVPYRLSNNKSYYNDPSKEFEMVAEIVKNVSVNSNLDLDLDKDGRVDNVTFIFEGDGSGIFSPHKANHSNGSKINGKNVDVFNVHNGKDVFDSPITGEEGVVAHEFLHSIGYPDLYPATGNGKPVGMWDIMGNVSTFLQYPLAYLRRDWLNIDTVTTSGKYTLNPATSKDGTQALILKTPLSQNEFFMVEYRKKGASYVGDLEEKIPGTGLIIYRVNTDVSTNKLGAPYHIYVFRPGETSEGAGMGNLNESFLSLESGRTSYGKSDLSAKITDNAITYSSGMNSGIVIENVSSAGDKISFDIKFTDLDDAGLWETVGNQSVTDRGSNQFSMDVVKDEVYTTYSESSGVKKLRAAKFNGKKWENIGGYVSSSGAYDAKIKVHNNTPYVIYHNDDYKLVVSKFEGGTWSNIVNISTDYSQYSDIESTKNGLYIAYTEPNASNLKVAKLNSSTGKFEQLGSNVASGYIHGISITELDGVVYVAYSNLNESNKIYIKKYNGSWSNVGSLNAEGAPTSIAAQDGKLYLAKGASLQDNTIKSYVFENDTWKQIGKDIAGEECLNPNIEIYKSKPYIAYVDYKKSEVIVKSFDGTNWVNVGMRVSDRKANKLDLKIVDGTAYVGYFDTGGAVEVKSILIEDKDSSDGSTGGGNSSSGSTTVVPLAKEIKGEDRFATAGDIAKKWSRTDNVFITNAYSMIDAMAATPLAHLKSAPILLTEKSKLNSRTKKELVRLKTKTVYLIGGKSVLDKNLENEIKKMGIKVVRIAGDDRFKTSLEIAKQIDKIKDVSEIALVNGEKGLADAVSISAIASERGMPIILSTISNKIPEGKDFIKSENIKKAYVIGGKSAISTGLENELKQLINKNTVTRMTGIDRTETNTNIIKYFYTSDKLKNAYVVKDGMNSEADLVDSLTVGPLAAKEKSPVVLVGKNLSKSQKALLGKKSFTNITKVGGNGNENAFKELKKLLKAK